MVFNHRLYIRLIARSLFRSRRTHARLTPRRLRFLSFFTLLYPLLELGLGLCFLLDDLLYPGFRKQRIERPLFIIGNYRSGSTFLHRVLAEDTRSFATLRTWEIYLAPSIVQRKILRGIGAVDRMLGGPLHRFTDRWENRVLRPVEIHRTGLRQPEEDEGLFFYIGYSLFVWFFFPFVPTDEPFHLFDRRISGPRRRRIMRFYRGCIQRHVYYHGMRQGRRPLVYLAKNPALSPRVDALLETFPDARFIYLYRRPEETLPSTLSWLSFCWSFFGDPLDRYPFRGFVTELTKQWYLYPLERLESVDERQWAVVRFEDLVQSPEQTLRLVCRRLDIPLSEGLERVIGGLAGRSERYRNHHSYALEDAGLTRERLREEYREVYRELARLESNDTETRETRETDARCHTLSRLDPT